MQRSPYILLKKRIAALMANNEIIFFIAIRSQNKLT